MLTVEQMMELVELEQMLKKIREAGPPVPHFAQPAEPLTLGQKIYYEKVSEKLRAGETVDLSEVPPASCEARGGKGGE